MEKSQSGNSEELLNLTSRSETFSIPRVLLIGFTILLGGMCLLRFDAARALSRSKASLGSRAMFGQAPAGLAQLAASYGRLPLGFEPNQGQSDPQVKFLTRGSGYSLYLTGNQSVLALSSTSSPQNSILRMSLNHANNTAIVGASGQLPGKSNYFIGNDPAQWHRNVPQFARVEYRDVYPGINLVYYGSQGALEYDFEVSPGADPSQVSLLFDAPQKLNLSTQGNLLIASGSGNVELQAPHIYQMIGAGQKPVAGRFSLRGNEVGFQIGDYDHSRALIIDPLLTYSTYLGGTGSESCSTIEQAQLGISTAQGTPGCPAIAVDSAFRTYIAGATTSLDFPGIVTAAAATANVPASFQACLDTPPPNPISPVSPSPCPTGLTNSDVFITRLNAAGTGLDFTTYLGGAGTDITAGIAVDPNFNVHVAGITNSANFPTLASSYQPVAASAGTHAFVSEISASGASLLYSTYLSGTGTDIATGVAVDNLGKEYVSGTTTSATFPTTPTALQTTPKATDEYFFSKLDPTITGPGGLVYSTYIGGSMPANGLALGGGIAVDTNCNAYLTGGTNFVDMPTLNANQGVKGAGLDAWVAKFSVPTGAPCSSQLSLTYLTYFGGSGDDIAYGIAVDTSFNAYITGSTTSPDISRPSGSSGPAPFAGCLNEPPQPTTAYPLPGSCPATGSAPDAFVAKFGNLTTSGTAGTNVPFLYFTYLGGTLADTGTAIATDNLGGALVTGWTMSTDFPAVSVLTGAAVQPHSGGGEDAFVARIDTSTICTPNPTTTPPISCPGYVTYLGGTGTDIGTGVAVDSQTVAYVTGETASPNFPVVAPFQSTLNGSNPDAFVSKFAPVASLAITPTVPTTVGVGNPVAFTYTIINNGDPASDIVVTDALPATGITVNSITATPGSCGTVVTSTVTCSIGALSSGATTTVTVNLTPTAQSTPLTAPGGISNSLSVSAPGAQTQTASSTAAVQDFNIAIEPGTPAAVTVPAGVPANFTFLVTGTFNNYPDSISLSAAAGLPTAATATWSTNPIPTLVGGPQTSILTISTTARVTTTTRLWGGRGALYAMFLPLSGMAFLGLGIGGKTSRKRSALIGLILGGLFALIIFQAGCGSTSTTSTTTGTPAGTYAITVDATSGTASRPTTVTLIVQ